jgi:hypothetical protein
MLMAERIIFRATSADIAKHSALTQETEASPSEVMRAVLRAATPKLDKQGLKRAQ